jgi:hypothetical protein
MTIRVIERDNGEIMIQRRKTLLWFTIYKTHLPTQALHYLKELNVEYNEKTGYYE